MALAKATRNPTAVGLLVEAITNRTAQGKNRVKAERMRLKANAITNSMQIEALYCTCLEDSCNMYLRCLALEKKVKQYRNIAA